MLSPVSVVARALVAAALAATLLSAPAAQAARPAGIGDPYYPSAGNPGYDVRHYALDVRYRPGSGLLTGDAVVRLKARHRLERLNLDLLLRARSVTVDGRQARFTQGRHELTVIPRRPVAKGRTVEVEVVYRGRPARLRYDGERPFERTATGAIAVGEPNIAAWWFPSNDHPSDKASFDIRLTVPAGYEAVSNGALLGHRSHAGLATWRWRMAQPMATYLAFAAFGQYDLQRGRTASGLPYVYAWEHGLGGVAKAARTSVRFSPQAIAFLSGVWGSYPFDQLGGVVPAARLGYALENQTRPVYGRDMFTYGAARSLVVHELAHQWFGDRVSVRRWRDIWLNEGFATYSEWLWQAHRGEIGPQRRLMRLYHVFEAGNPFWRLAIGDPGRARLFDDAVYVRGAMTAQALRNRVGDRDFFAITRRWTHAGDGVGSSREFERLAARVSGERLGPFFDHWLRSRVKPAPTAENGLD